MESSSIVSVWDSGRGPDPNGNFRRTDPSLFAGPDFPAGTGALGDWGGLNSGGDGGVGEAIADLEVADFGRAGAGIEVAIDGAAARAAWIRGTAVDFDAGFKEFV